MFCLISGSGKIDEHAMVMNAKYKTKLEKSSLKADLSRHKWKVSVGWIV